MKKSKELDVDFIGGQEPMTKEEEKALNEFFIAKKLLRDKKQTRRTKTAKRKKVVA